MNRMSMPSWDRIKAVFAEACELPGEQVPAFLDRVCEGDAELRREVESLLAARSGKQVATGGAARELAAASTMRSAIISEGAGTIIGPYKLLQLIGEGGFGSVFLAEQTQPVRRRVAVKIIKLGMDTKQVIARFEAERQALALMDHPHIAKVLDGGATPLTERGGGRPYFVMEYVTGDPITTFANAHKLTIKDRLALFAQVCQAVQHAHMKGVIHRDIKPGNVLVSMTDGKPFAKVIDFGIAKATAGPGGLTDKTLFTEHRQLIGTPEYMSPEQAEGNADIDTRTDVYALGVLLYELLTGLTPFDGQRLRSAAYGEMQRIIKEEEPPLPSLRLSRAALASSGTGIPSAPDHHAAALTRQVPASLTAAQLKGELDWIVMKALDKDRARRYETPNQLAADVQRHVSGEAVVAAPPSAAYRLQKFVRRNKGAVIAGSAITAVLLFGIAGTTFGLLSAQRQKDRLQTQVAIAKESIGQITDELIAEETREANIAQMRQEVATNYPQASPEEAEIRTLGVAANWALNAFKYERRRLTEKNVELAALTDAAEWSAYTANLALAQAAIDAGDYPEARNCVMQAPVSKQGWEWKLLSLKARAVDTMIRSHFQGLVFSNDGTRVSPFLPVADYLADTGEQVAADETDWPRSVYLASLSASGEVQVSQPSSETSRWEQDTSVRMLVERLTGEQVSRIDFVSFDRVGAKLSWLSGGIGWPDTPSHRVVSVDQWGGPERDLDRPLSYVSQYEIKTRPAPESLIALRIVAILAASPNGPTGLTITTPDGSRRITRGNAEGGVFSDNTVRLYDAKDGKPTLPATTESPEGVYREVAVFRMPEAVTNLQMTGDGTRLIIHLEGGSARVWDIRDPEERRKDLQAEWAERVPAGAYLDTLWATDTSDDKLRDAVFNDASLTPLRRLVAAEMLEERLEDDRIAAEEALAIITKDQTDKNAVVAAAATATLPKRVKARVVAEAEQWEYQEPPMTESQRRVALAEAAVVFEQVLAERFSTDESIVKLRSVLNVRTKLLGPSDLATAAAMHHLGQYLAFQRKSDEGLRLLRDAAAIRVTATPQPSEELLRWQALYAAACSDHVATEETAEAVRAMGATAQQLQDWDASRIYGANLWPGGRWDTPDDRKATAAKWLAVDDRLIAEMTGRRAASAIRTYVNQQHPQSHALCAIYRWRLAESEDACVDAANVELGGKVLDRDGHRAAAREALARARALMQPAADGTPSPWANDEDAKALIAEAEFLIGGAP